MADCIYLINSPERAKVTQLESGELEFEPHILLTTRGICLAWGMRRVKHWSAFGRSWLVTPI